MPSLFADVGGVLGLFVGLSVLALFELIEFTIDIIKVFLGPILCKNKSMKKSGGYQPPTEMSSP